MRRLRLEDEGFEEQRIEIEKEVKKRPSPKKEEVVEKEEEVVEK